MTQNTIHIQQMVIPSRYLSRHSYLPSTRAMTDISDHGLRMYQQTEAPYWRKVRSERRQKQYDEQGLDRIEHIDGHFTGASGRSEEHTSELQSRGHLVCRLLLEKKTERPGRNYIRKHCR